MITTILVGLAMSQAGGWTATSVTPVTIARRADERLATLSKATLDYQYTYYRSDAHKEAGKATAACVGHIVAPGVFWLQVPDLNFSNRQPLNYAIWISDGKRFSGVIDPADPNPVPVAKRPPGPARPASVWFKDFSAVILSGLGRRTHPLEGFVKDARRQGFKVTSHVRKMTFHNVKRTDYRIVAQKGAARYEIVFDGRGGLPTSVTNTIGKTDASRWRAVLWHLRPGAALNRAAVQFRKKAPAPTLSPTPRRP